MQFFSNVISQRKFDSWNVDKKKLLNDLLLCEGKINFEELIKVVYASFPSFFDKDEIKIIGDKNPIYSIYPSRLVKLFPNAKFIHLNRDYRDNILSIKKVDFEAPFTGLLAWRWRYSAKLIEKTKQKNQEKFLTLRYEDLVSDPEKELKQLCSFLGISYQANVLQYHEKAKELFNDQKREFKSE